MRYQETWVQGSAQPGIPAQRSCADRYEVIRIFGERYARPFSVFDLGANLGYFSFRLAEDFGAVCVMADNREELGDLCRLNNSGNVTWLNTRLDPATLWSLGESEYFDIVLAMSVLHHFGPQWKVALESLLRIGQHVIVELPALDDVGTLNAQYAQEMHAYMKTAGGVFLAEFPSHKSGKPRPCYLLYGSACTILKQTIDAPDRGAPDLGGVHVRPTYIGVDVEIRHGGASPCNERRDFILGMNLWNFLLLNGAWPDKSTIMMAAERALADVCGDDLEPWNMILRGSEIRIIDQNTKAWKTSNNVNARKLCLSKIQEKLYGRTVE